jgi:hypothetical protein
MNIYGCLKIINFLWKFYKKKYWKKIIAKIRNRSTVLLVQDQLPNHKGWICLFGNLCYCNLFVLNRTLWTASNLVRYLFVYLLRGSTRPIGISRRLTILPFFLLIFFQIKITMSSSQKNKTRKKWHLTKVLIAQPHYKVLSANNY